MNQKHKLWLAALAAALCVVTLSVACTPDRVPPEEQERRDRVQARVDRIHENAPETTEEAAESAQPAHAPEKTDTEPPATAKEDTMWPEEAPDVFKVKFECTNGDFIVECHKEWAPLGAQRFYTLVQEGFYDDSSFFRVVPGFVVQFGLAGDPEVTAKWRNKRIADDPVTQSNKSGTITFATSGPNSRTTQLFINLASNEQLDGMGFAPFGTVTEGMDVVKSITDKYRELPNQMLLTTEGNAYVRKNFPNIDFIKKASLIK